ncbi:inosine/uridine-preferring nucleoside hydrolase [Xylariales sp. AK1849]|nr:inosine/uridine-preferring nucleoside hydrolase [Xylariales sp. AK1849]
MLYTSIGLAVLISSVYVVAGYDSTRRSLIIDSDLFSDVDDAGALLLAATSPKANLLAVNINYPSSYSALCGSAILAHYGLSHVPIGISRPITNESFFDSWAFELGEYASKVAYHYAGGNLAWGEAEDAWDPVALYRKVLSEVDDNSVTIASVGFFDNLSGLLNSTSDSYSNLTGPELIAEKVQKLVIMGGGYPSGYEFNFWGGNPSYTAHVVNSWEGQVVFSGSELGGNVSSGGPLMRDGPKDDPVRQAYIYYTYGTSRFSWDPLTVLYAIDGLGDLLEYGNEFGYNHVYPNGSNEWVFDEAVSSQRWLNLKVDNVTAGAALDNLFLNGAWSVAMNTGTTVA